MGNEPSGGRALGHAIMDVLTLGVWEVVGTPIEAASSSRMRLTIVYKDDKIKTIRAGETKGGLN